MGENHMGFAIQVGPWEVDVPADGSERVTSLVFEDLVGWLDIKNVKRACGREAEGKRCVEKLGAKEMCGLQIVGYAT